MEFFFFLEREGGLRVPFLFRVAQDTTFLAVVERFVSQAGRVDFAFDTGKYKLYVEVLKSASGAVKIEQVTDYSRRLSDFRGQCFSLIFSATPPYENAMPQLRGNDPRATEIDLAIRSQNLRRALQLMKKVPEQQRTVQLRMKLSLKSGDYEGVVEMAHREEETVRGNKRCLLFLAKAYEKMGEFERAMECLKSIPSVKPREFEDFEVMHYAAAKMCCRRGMFEEAKGMLSSLSFCKGHQKKVDMLRAKIEVNCGSWFSGILAALNALSDNIRDLKAMKILGENVRTKEEAQFVFSNMGDSRNNPNVLNFLGFILNEHGSLETAKYFYELALGYSPNDIPILIGKLKNDCSLSLPIDQFLKVAKSAVQVVLKSNILDGLPVNLDVFGRDDKQIDLKPFVLLKLGKEKNPFQIEQMDAIWLLVIVETYLFTHGFISNAQLIADSVYKLTNNYNLNESVIEEEIIFNKYLLSLSSTIQRPLPELKKIYFIGDERSILFSWQKLHYNNEEYMLCPIIISGILPKHFSKHKCSQNTELNSVVNSIPNDSLVLFSLSCIESNIWINSLKGTDKIEKYDRLLLRQINPFLKKIRAIQEEKHWKIWINPLFIVQSNEIKTIVKFNDKLKNDVLEINKENQNMKFLDTLNCFIDTSNMIYNTEYIEEGLYLSLKYIKVFENLINSEQT